MHVVYRLRDAIWVDFPSKAIVLDIIYKFQEESARYCGTNLEFKASNPKEVEDYGAQRYLKDEIIDHIILS